MFSIYSSSGGVEVLISDAFSAVVFVFTSCLWGVNKIGGYDQKIDIDKP